MKNAIGDAWCGSYLSTWDKLEEIRGDFSVRKLLDVGDREGADLLVGKLGVEELQNALRVGDGLPHFQQAVDLTHTVRVAPVARLEDLRELLWDGVADDFAV